MIEVIPDELRSIFVSDHFGLIRGGWEWWRAGLRVLLVHVVVDAVPEDVVAENVFAHEDVGDVAFEGEELPEAFGELGPAIGDEVEAVGHVLDVGGMEGRFSME